MEFLHTLYTDPNDFATVLGMMSVPSAGLPHRPNFSDICAVGVRRGGRGGGG
jgi:hypothetical protein